MVRVAGFIDISGVAQYVKDAAERVNASGGAGSFEFNPDGVQEAIDKLEDIVDRFTKAKQTAEGLTYGLPKDVDPVSLDFVDEAVRFGEAYGKWDGGFIKRLEDFGSKLVKIREDMLAREDKLGAAFSKVVND